MAMVQDQAVHHSYRRHECSSPLHKVRACIHVLVLTIETFLGRDALIQEIRNNDVTVLLGETGSGKTTRA